jgi:hypothetical protein
MRPRSYTVAFALLAGLAAQACVAVAAWAAGSAVVLTPRPTTTAKPVVVARYTFDSRAGAIVDQTGRGHTMTVVASHGGVVRSVAHGAGEGVAFPPKCSAKTNAPCPHAVLQSPNSGDLNPGMRPLAYGAALRLGSNQTSKGQNVLQKGYSATSSQYKLQVDGIAGRPSCVLVDTRTPVIKLVRSSVTVADGVWHTVECSRAGEVFIILVDGVIRGTLKIPAALSVTNTSPLSIGGKGTSKDNDQFHGAVDDVWVRIG